MGWKDQSVIQDVAVLRTTLRHLESTQLDRIAFFATYEHVVCTCTLRCLVCFIWDVNNQARRGNGYSSLRHPTAKLNATSAH